MPIQVFISRTLASDSPFKAQLEAVGYVVHGQSLIDFQPVPFQPPDTMDWLFAYSSRGVHFFFEDLPPGDWASARWAVMGEGTAQALRGHGISPSFVGSGQPEEVAETFGALAKGQRVVFLQAAQSRQSVQQLLGDTVQTQSLVVYDNQPLSGFTLPPCEVLVFTSPLNVHAYFNQYVYQAQQYLVAIGTTTAAALTRLTGLNRDAQRLLVADQPTETHLAQTVLAIF